MILLQNPAIQRYVWPILKLAFGISIIAWLFVSGQFELEIYQRLYEQSQLGLLTIAFLLQFASTTVLLSRWWYLVNAQGIGMPLGTVLRVGYRGIFASILLPGSIGLDGIRIVHVQQNHRSKLTEGFASVVVDRALGLLALLIIAVVASVYFWLKNHDDFMANIIIVELIVLAIMIIPVYLSSTSFAAKFGHWYEKFDPVSKFIKAAKIYRQNPAPIVYVLGISIAGHLMTCFAWLLAMQALNNPPPASLVVVVTPILMILRTLPITPMGLGVTDTAAEGFYNQLGIGIGAESQMLMRFINIIIIVFSGVAFFLKDKPKEIL